MTDLDQLLPLWQELRDAGQAYVLATIVAVEGSGYRKPGARMLISADGRRAGTISGGCLEAEVAKKAFWHTENGPVVRRYSTAADDGDVPFGMGCGGVVHVLLERAVTAGPLMARLGAQYRQRQPLAIATVLDGSDAGRHKCWPAEEGGEFAGAESAQLQVQSLAHKAFEEQRTFSETVPSQDGQTAQVWAEFCPARPGLLIVGAGDDAVPLAKMARQLGWYVVVADGRSHLATQLRFAEADEVHVLQAGAFPELTLRPTDSVAIMTHSLEQDTRALSHLLGMELGYLGVLGPHRRTVDMLRSVAETQGNSDGDVNAVAARWLQRIHAPMGLDLGGQTPRDVALAILAEIQLNRNRASGLPLRAVRGRVAEQVSEQALA